MHVGLYCSVVDAVLSERRGVSLELERHSPCSRAGGSGMKPRRPTDGRLYRTCMRLYVSFFFFSQDKHFLDWGDTVFVCCRLNFYKVICKVAQE